MNIISPDEIEQIIRVRDIGMMRVDVATQTRKKQLAANTDEEYNSIPIPRLYPFNCESVFLEHSKIEETLKDRFYEDFLLDMYCRGFTMNINGYIVSKYGNMGAVGVSDLYRGEIKDFGSQCTSSLGRKIHSGSFEEKIINFFIHQMKILCFYGFLTYFKQFTEFKIGTPMAHIIAQHYGLYTQFLDLTDDVKVALFFACCKHIGNNKYRPIDKNDLPQIGKYGVLYHGVEDDSTQIIGYQPFTRCHKQRGYFIDTAANIPCWHYSLVETTNFTKSLFERSSKLSNRLFEEFDGGNSLFPKDSLFYFEDIISNIMNTKTFPIDVFNQTYELIMSYLTTYETNGFIKNNIAIKMTKDWFYKKTTERSIELTEQLKLSSGKTGIIDEINKKWDPSMYKKKEDIIAWGRETIPLKNGDFYMSKGRHGIYTI